MLYLQLKFPLSSVVYLRGKVGLELQCQGIKEYEAGQDKYIFGNTLAVIICIVSLDQKNAINLPLFLFFSIYLFIYLQRFSAFDKETIPAAERHTH